METVGDGVIFGMEENEGLEKIGRWIDEGWRWRRDNSNRQVMTRQRKKTSRKTGSMPLQAL